MKKLVNTITITVMLSTVGAFASEGDADQLAGAVFGIVSLLIGLYVGMFVLYGAVEFIAWFSELCSNFWNNSTTLGKLVVFGIPLTVVSGFIFYGIIYYAIPWVVSSAIPFIVHDTFGNIIAGIVLYFVCMLVGWGNGDYTTKRAGRVATVARFIVLLPFLPVIYLGYYLVQLFKAVCIKDSVVNFNPHIVRR